MARALRLEMTDGTYHVWNRGVNRGDIVFDDRDRQHFVDLLPKVVRRYGWVVYEFVLMTNHFLCAAAHKKCYGERPVMWSWRGRPAANRVGAARRCA